MKLGAVTLAYRDESTIRGTLACLRPFVDKYVVVWCDKPFHGQRDPMDSTLDICRKFDVELIQCDKQEHEMRNVGQEALSDCDWVIGFDADEMMSYDDLFKLKRALSGCTKANAVGFISKVYWGTPDYILSPDPDHVKVCVTRPSVRFWTKQCINEPYYIFKRNEGLCMTHHHLSWCLPKDILGKVLHYSHADEFDGQKWYDEVFTKWKPGDKAVQPFGSVWDVVHDHLPEKLRCLL